MKQHVVSESVRISNISWQVGMVQWGKIGEAAVVAVFCEPTKLFIYFAKLQLCICENSKPSGRMGEVRHIIVSGNTIKSPYRYFQALPIDQLFIALLYYEFYDCFNFIRALAMVYQAFIQEMTQGEQNEIKGVRVIISTNRAVARSSQLVRPGSTLSTM